MDLSDEAKKRLRVVLDIIKTTFHWGFMPMVLYLGFSKGAEPGMPQLSLYNLLWQ